MTAEKTKCCFICCTSS